LSRVLLVSFDYSSPATDGHSTANRHPARRFRSELVADYDMPMDRGC
jgi:hypothetical protein